MNSQLINTNNMIGKRGWPHRRTKQEVGDCSFEPQTAARHLGKGDSNYSTSQDDTWALSSLWAHMLTCALLTDSTLDASLRMLCLQEWPDPQEDALTPHWGPPVAALLYPFLTQNYNHERLYCGYLVNYQTTMTQGAERLRCVSGLSQLFAREILHNPEDKNI